jgi:hypothetical protein
LISKLVDAKYFYSQWKQSLRVLARLKNENVKHTCFIPKNLVAHFKIVAASAACVNGNAK